MRLHRDYHLNPLVLLKLAICKLRLAGLFGLVEFCHRCGRRVRDVWWAQPELWYEVEGVGDAGCRCIRCFSLDCHERGKLLVWVPRVEHQRDARGEWQRLTPPDPELYPVAARLHAEAHS